MEHEGKGENHQKIPLPKDSRFQNMTGLQFGRMTVIEYAGKSKSNATLWTCKCNCGKIKTVHATNLKKRRHKKLRMSSYGNSKRIKHDSRLLRYPRAKPGKNGDRVIYGLFAFRMTLTSINTASPVMGNHSSFPATHKEVDTALIPLMASRCIA